MTSWWIERKLPQKCPFCPASNNRLFDEVGLLQHAIAISKSNANPELVRTHSVLLDNLKGRLNNITSTRDRPLLIHPAMNLVSQQQQNVIPMPKDLDSLDKDKKGARDQDVEMKIVWPWMGILMNVNYEQIAKNDKNNCQDKKGKAIYIPAWDTDIKSHFAYLNPRGVQALWNQGLAVLDFGQDLLGYFDAHDFERGFAQCKRGKREFENMTKHRQEQAQEMFGWLADESDFNQMNCVGEILRKRGALRAKPQAWTEQHDILLQDVRSRLQEKNIKLMQLGKEVCNLQTLVYQSENDKYSAEAQFLLKERKRKQELETINEKMNKATKAQNDEIMREREKINSLQAELRYIQEKCQHLEENNAQSTSDETLIPKLIDLVEEKEGLQDTLEKLIYKEREVNDKFQSAMEAAKEVLAIKGNTESIGIKKVGQVTEEAWKKACAQKYKGRNEGWEIPYTKVVSKWNDVYLRDPSWFPYKLVPTEGGKFEEHIDPNDGRLAKLRQDFGAEVYKTVVDALNELREFNASGRYPIGIPWNFEQGRAAQLDEIIKYLALDSSKKRKSTLG